MLAHKAVHEAHVAAEVIAGELQGNKELAAAAFNARVILSVAYTDPEVAWVGLTEDQAKAQGIKVKMDLFPWTESGCAIANGRDEGVTKLLFDDSPEAHGHGKILGGGMVGTHAGDMIGEIALVLRCWPRNWAPVTLPCGKPQGPTPAWLARFSRMRSAIKLTLPSLSWLSSRTVKPHR